MVVMSHARTHDMPHTCDMTCVFFHLRAAQRSRLAGRCWAGGARAQQLVTTSRVKPCARQQQRGLRCCRPPAAAARGRLQPARRRLHSTMLRRTPRPREGPMQRLNLHGQPAAHAAYQSGALPSRPPPQRLPTPTRAVQLCAQPAPPSRHSPILLLPPTVMPARLCRSSQLPAHGVTSMQDAAEQPNDARSID